MSDLDDCCVFTIRDGSELKKRATEASTKPFTERKRWVTGHKLWAAARENNRAFPVLFGDAALDTSKLLYWGILTSVEIDDSGTTYRVDRLRKLRGRSAQELTLRNSGETIALGFIRPYALCLTPDFIRRARMD